MTVADLIRELQAMPQAMPVRVATKPHKASMSDTTKLEPCAWLHDVEADDGEPDQALSFSADSFPLESVGGFHSIQCSPLVRLADAQVVIERLTAERDAAVADARRYRWLRDHAQGEIVFDNTESQRDGGHHFALRVPFDGREIPDDDVSARVLDESIDAALASQEGAKQP